MKRILVLGAGQSSPFLIRYLLDKAAVHDWRITVGDLDESPARRQVGDHPRGEAVRFDVTHPEQLTALVEQTDLVVYLLAPRFMHSVAWECVRHGAHMVSVSYRDQDIRDLDEDARRKGVILLNEMGLDPGIDHMTAMSTIERVRSRGGVITRFLSYGSGLPAPDSLNNPLHYFITWNPRNIVMSGIGGAQFLEEGRIKVIPYHRIFDFTWPVEVEGIGTLEAYPNRDSLSYKQQFGLKHTETMIRGTLRYPGWSETWSRIIRLGLANEVIRIPDLRELTYREFVEMFLPKQVNGSSLEQRVAAYLDISPTGVIMENLKWLGLFSDQPVGLESGTATDVMISLIRRKLKMDENSRDMVILVHDLLARYPEEGGRQERVVSTFVEYGERGGVTAMAKTVGLPAAIAVEMILSGQLPLTGSHIPIHPTIYEPVLRKLEEHGFRFQERVEPVSP